MKILKFYYLICLISLIISCKPQSSNQNPTDGYNKNKKPLRIDTLNRSEVSTPTHRLESGSIAQKKSTTDSFILDINEYYVPNVETCLYIRSAPIIVDSTIIQCLIPIKQAEFVTEMWHELIPTGLVKGDWAEFKYHFEIYTMKPDQPHDENMDKWHDTRKKVHDRMREKYKTYRKKGWIRYRDPEGHLNINIRKDGG
jgi:hypothetical protein